MKVSDLKTLLDSIPEGQDPSLVTGDDWLPERLIQARLDEDLLYLTFDNAPEDIGGDEEARGFVDHEIEMIRNRFKQILDENTDTKTKTDAMLALFLMGHELSSSEIIELMEAPEDPTKSQ
ncbi:hypothetical protein ACFFUP_01175 [Vibrio ostreicida]|uniref:Uncharacterized protein n=1 Tax=Vibrio ostreicida TaxID=526588 RepID=A0ABT8BT43_9VIBR|nr:hypothetical protein [Vibrio ostreicida]MDN3610290.1 hypothetical protein [Vibrio ostreicida]MDN3610986.1 hypothetical protein [Vibrio ostreicida]NPD07696.1 hypothetical protein [Vibrio ostreicida]